MLSVTIKWRQVDRWHIVSDCGLYKISKAIVKDNAMYVPWFAHQEWHMGKEIKQSRNLSNGVRTVEAAKLICETHKKTKAKDSTNP